MGTQKNKASFPFEDVDVNESRKAVNGCSLVIQSYGICTNVISKLNSTQQTAQA